MHYEKRRWKGNNKAFICNNSSYGCSSSSSKYLLNKKAVAVTTQTTAIKNHCMTNIEKKQSEIEKAVNEHIKLYGGLQVIHQQNEYYKEVKCKKDSLQASRHQ